MSSATIRCLYCSIFFVLRGFHPPSLGLGPKQGVSSKWGVKPGGSSFSHRWGHFSVASMERPTPPSSFLLGGEKKLHRVDSQTGKDDGRERIARHCSLTWWHECAFLSCPCMRGCIHRTHGSLHPFIHHPCHSFSSPWDPSVERSRFRPIPPTSKRTYPAWKHRFHTTVPQQLDGRSTVSIRRLLLQRGEETPRCSDGPDRPTRRREERSNSHFGRAFQFHRHHRAEWICKAV